MFIRLNRKDYYCIGVHKVFEYRGKRLILTHISKMIFYFHVSPTNIPKRIFDYKELNLLIKKIIQCEIHIHNRGFRIEENAYSLEKRMKNEDW